MNANKQTTEANAEKGKGNSADPADRGSVSASRSVHATAASINDAPDARRRILLADDNVDLATSMATMLEMMGAEVYVANDGAAAVAAGANFHPHMIFLDIGMPKLNGYDACRIIRKQAWGKHAVIVALTGWGQLEDKQRSLDAGFDQHLIKPIEPALLEKMVGSIRGQIA